MTSVTAAINGRESARRTQFIVATTAIIVLAAIAPFYKREIVEAIRAWIDSPTYNHCFLVIPIVSYLIWGRRNEIADLAPRPTLGGLFAIAGLSAVWLVAAKLDIIEARQFLFIGIVEGVLFTVLGASLYMRLLGPLLYLFFLVPSGQFLIPKLQDITAKLAIAGLQLVAVPVYSDGIFIQIPEGSFVIAEACGGLRFLVASVAYGVLFALLVYNSWRRRIAFLTLSVVIPVIANGMRAFGIIFAAHIIGSAAAAEADHILYGWLFFSIVIFLLTLAGMTFSDRPRFFSAGPVETLPRTLARPSKALLLAVAAGTMLVAVSAPSSLIFIRGQDLNVQSAWLDLPKPTQPWTLQPTEPQWRPALAGPDREFADTFTDGQGTVERYVAIFVPHGDNNVMGSLGRPAAGITPWERGNIRTASAQIGRQSGEVEVSEIRSEDGQRRLVLSFYIVHSKIVASTLRAKLLEAYASFSGGGRAVAYFAISTAIDSTDIDREARLQQFLKSMGSLDAYIASIN